MFTAILNLLILSDQEDGHLKNVHSPVDGQTVTINCAISFPNLNKYFVEYMQ